MGMAIADARLIKKGKPKQRVQRKQRRPASSLAKKGRRPDQDQELLNFFSRQQFHAHVPSGFANAA